MLIGSLRIEPESPRTAPASAGAVLCGRSAARCPAKVRGAGAEPGTQDDAKRGVAIQQV